VAAILAQAAHCDDAIRLMRWPGARTDIEAPVNDVLMTHPSEVMISGRKWKGR